MAEENPPGIGQWRKESSPGCNSQDANPGHSSQQAQANVLPRRYQASDQCERALSWCQG